MMRFKEIGFMKAFDWFYIIPSVVVMVNMPTEPNKNFAISFHWLGFHLRFKWEEKEE